MHSRIFKPSIAGICLLAAGSAWGQSFSIEGKITLSKGAQAIVAPLSAGERRVSLDFRHNETTSPPIRSITAEAGEKYKVLFERDLRGRDIHVTAETPQGTVLASDYVVDVNRQLEFLNERRSIWAIPLDIRLTTVPDRFLAEVHGAEKNLRAGNHESFFLEIDRILDFASSQNDEIYYRSRQLFAEGLHVAFKAGFRPPDAAVIRVQGLGSESGFQGLAQERRYALFLQLARAISQSQFVPGTAFGGTEQWQVVDTCFLGALEAARDVKSLDEIARLQVEHVGHLNQAGKDDAVFPAVSSFFESMPADISLASRSQRNSAIPMLSVLADILERKKSVMIFTLEENIEHAAADVSLMDIWVAFERYARPWEAQLPSGSKKDVVRRLRALLDRALEVVGRTTADG